MRRLQLVFNLASASPASVLAIVIRFTQNRPPFAFAQMCVKPEEVERFRLALPRAARFADGEPPELDQPGLVRVQLQAELREPLAQLGQEPLGILPCSKPTMKSSAQRTMITSPRACRFLHQSAHRSRT